MDIKTKYNINDIVYFLYDNKIQSGDITRIHISVRQGAQSEKYDGSIVPGSGEFINLKKDMLFKTKEALIASL